MRPIYLFYFNLLKMCAPNNLYPQISPFILAKNTRVIENEFIINPEADYQQNNRPILGDKSTDYCEFLGDMRIEISNPCSKLRPAVILNYCARIDFNRTVLKIILLIQT